MWVLLMINIVSTKLDSSTKRDWKVSKLTSELPTLDEIRDFLSCSFENYRQSKKQ